MVIDLGPTPMICSTQLRRGTCTGEPLPARAEGVGSVDGVEGVEGGLSEPR